MGLYPHNLNEFVASMGIPRGPLSKAFLVDTELGSDNNPGTSWEAPLKTLEAAEDLCTTNRHDAVLFLARATADNPAASVGWTKSYTHLIGVGSLLPGLGQRSRVVMAAATALTPTITFSGNGCIVKNMQFNQEKVTGAASGVGVVSGERNYFENVFFMCPTAQDAESYSLKVTGAENAFKRCTIGQFTNVRNGASYSLWLAGASNNRNKFIKCELLSWSTASVAHVHAYIDAAITEETFTVIFEDCLWSNFAIAAGSLLTASIVDACTVTGHQILLRGKNDFAGVTAVANPLTNVLSGRYGAAGARSGHLMVTVAET